MSFMDLFNALNFSEDKDVLEIIKKLAEFVDKNNWVEKFGYLKIKKAFQATLAIGEMSGQKMSEEGKSSGAIWVCDECGQKCRSERKKEAHIAVTNHKVYTVIPEDQTTITKKYSEIIHQSDEFVLWESFQSLLRRVETLELKEYNRFDELADAFLKGNLTGADIKQLGKIGKKIRSVMKKQDLEVSEASSFKEWTPLNLLIRVWRFYDSQKREDYYFDDKFQNLMKHVETYLKCYQSTKTKWQHVIPKGEVAKHYRRIFEDDLVIIRVGECTLQFITKHDDFAYDIPLKLFREYCKFMIDCNKCQYFDFEKHSSKGKNCSECTFNPASKDNFLPF